MISPHIIDLYIGTCVEVKARDINEEIPFQDIDHKLFHDWKETFHTRPSPVTESQTWSDWISSFFWESTEHISTGEPHDATPKRPLKEKSSATASISHPIKHKHPLLFSAILLFVLLVVFAVNIGVIALAAVYFRKHRHTVKDL